MKQIRLDLVLTLDDEEEFDEPTPDPIDKIINDIYNTASDVDIIHCEEV